MYLALVILMVLKHSLSVAQFYEAMVYLLKSAIIYLVSVSQNERQYASMENNFSMKAKTELI